MNEPEAGFRAPLIEELEPLFPGYQFLSLIAVGGMGAVYHAIQTSLERDVAIKILPAEFGDDEEFCASFAAEAKTMARFNHPNLISVFDFGEADGMLFIVMEYVPGQSLHHACNGSALNVEEAVELMSGICGGLAHAHEQGILHRDIKPANILLDANLQPKVGDFGLARPLDTQLKEGETIFGTPGYTAPEVLLTPHSVDQRADIFSLGVMFQELLTGVAPFSGGDASLTSSQSDWDPHFNAVVRKATDPDPIERYQTAVEISDALENIVKTEGLKFIQTASLSNFRTTGDYLLQPVKKGRGGVLTGIGVLLVAAVAVMFVLRDQNSPTDDSVSDAPLVISDTPNPIKPDVVELELEPVEPEPGPVEVVPEPREIDSQPEPDAIASSVKPEPEPLQVKELEPKFDVKAFFKHARSVMIKRCESGLIKRDGALEQNLADFKREAERLNKRHLKKKWHKASKKEVGEFIDICKQNGNRVGDGLKKPLKFKKWLVVLHKEYLAREFKIGEKVVSELKEHQKTYLYGLGLKVMALENEDDPVAVDLIKGEVDRVVSDKNYFSDLMRGENGSF